jgi:hypothetical protein
MGLYQWNLDVSAAFWAPLATLEVTLRNRLYECGAEFTALGAPHPATQQLQRPTLTAEHLNPQNFLLRVSL